MVLSFKPFGFCLLLVPATSTNVAGWDHGTHQAFTAELMSREKEKKGNYRDVISQNKRTKPLRLSGNETAVPIDFSHTMFLQQKHSSANRGPV